MNLYLTKDNKFIFHDIYFLKRFLSLLDEACSGFTKLCIIVVKSGVTYEFPSVYNTDPYDVILSNIKDSDIDIYVESDDKVWLGMTLKLDKQQNCYILGVE